MAPLILGDLPPCLYFAPDDEELIRLYLLPRVRGQPDIIPGLIIDDDSAANTQPWKLFNRHGLPKADQPDQVPVFFFVHTNGAARPDRGCHGGGSWKSMKSGEQVLPLVDAEKIKWTRHNLNFQMGSGSIGWVMHEYFITDHPSLKICSISFTGHCKKRMRAPDGYEEEDSLAAGEHATQRPRLAAAHDDSALAASSSASASMSTAFVQDLDTTQASEYQEPGMLLLSDEEITAMVEEMSNAQKPDSAFQEQLQAMAQPVGTVQEPTEPTTMEQWVVDQEPSVAHQTSEDEEIAAMIAEMADSQPQPFVVCDKKVPVMEEQQVEQEPSMFDGSSYTDLLLQGIVTPSSCCVPNISDMAGGTQGAFDWEGFRFVY
ncbi:hypothetical protein QOZ80_2AG0110800 [Eleusine coracana subsp. coracana]|nr:hypothetical protein QOZ80_2AG0110800 [Eleusine coracana subsp. coracana]